jgi:hypothetical protein
MISKTPNEISGIESDVDVLLPEKEKSGPSVTKRPPPLADEAF